MCLSIKNEIKSSFAIKFYKKLHRKQTNEDFDFFIGLIDAMSSVALLYFRSILLHNENYVVNSSLCRVMKK